MDSNNYSNKSLKSIRRSQLGNESESRAERRLWKTLLSKRQSGERFLRQQSIGNYVVGFFCPDLKLVVEIDGNSDFSIPEYHILRFSEDEIINRLEDVNERLQHVIYGLREKEA